MALINLRNALMAGKRLPYDAEVEYLESTGTQYVNTGVILDSTYGIDILFAPMETSNVSEHGIFGSSVSGTGSVHNVLQIHTSAGGVGLWMPSGTRVASAAITVGTIQRWQININNNGDVIVDGVDKGDSHPATASACPYPVYLFARDVGGAIKSGSYSKMRLYSWTVTDASGNIIQQLIPVREGTVGYLYDRVSGNLFGNAGTGDFQYGQDVVPMTWQDGLQYNNVGTPVEGATSSIGLDYIPITAGHSFTWRLGYGSSASADLIIYNANKERIDYWAARDRTVTISGAAAYMRISALTSYKEQATVYDETAQKYVFANGRIPTGGAS